jgi:Ca-activated chloride channel family protein
VEFLWHHALWLLLALPAFAGAYLAWLRRRMKSAARYPSFALVNEAMTPASRLRPHVPPLLLFGGLAALLLAVSRPVFLTRAPTGQPTVVLLMDVSLSMAASDVPPTRLDAARAAAKRFVGMQPADVRLAVVAFGGHADVVQGPTTSRDSVRTALDRLELQRYTALGNGLIGALLTIIPDADVPQGYDIFGLGRPPLPDGGHDSTRRRRPGAGPPVAGAIILVSDGRGTMGVPAELAAKLIADFGIRVYTVGVGTLYGGVANVEGWPAVHAEFEEDTLKEVASITGGDYFLARSAKKVDKVYERLGRRAVFETGTREHSGLLAGHGTILPLAAAGQSLWWSLPTTRLA